LHLAFKTPQCVFQRLTFLNDDFGHVMNSPPIRFGLVSCGASAGHAAPARYSGGHRPCLQLSHGIARFVAAP
jgi:hypothetical protein